MATESGNKNYTIDIQCGPDIPENHYRHNIEVDKNCLILSGGPSDA